MPPFEFTFKKQPLNFRCTFYSTSAPTSIADGETTWKHLEAFLLDGHLEIDTSRSERSIKPFVIEKIGCSQIHREVLEEVPSCIVWLKPQKRII